MKVYGIKNCDTVKKALVWLESHDLSYEFNDFKKIGLSRELFDRWVNLHGWESLINRRGTTWRKLSEEEKSHVVDADTAFQVLSAHTSAIKRPVVDAGEKVLLGFDAEEYTLSFLR